MMTNLLGPRGAHLLDPHRLIELATVGLPEGLASATAVARLNLVPTHPGPLFSFGCFEVYPRDPDRVDFLACIEQQDGGRLAAIAFGPPVEPATTSELLKAWGTGEAPAGDVSALWYEWDVDIHGPRQPFVFIRMARRSPNGRWPEDRLARVVDWAMPRLTGPLPRDRWDAMRRDILVVNRRLPGDAHVAHLAAMPMRATSAVRIHVGLPRAKVVAFLGAMGWRGDPLVVGDLLGAWSRHPDPIGLQLDVGPDPPRRVDLEFYMDTPPNQDERWAPLIDRLMDGSVVPRSWLTRALRWADVDELIDDDTSMLRRISLKVLLSDEGSFDLKAYLGFSPRRYSTADRGFQLGP